MFLRLKKFGKGVLATTAVLLMAALIIGVVGSLAVGFLYWGACAMGGFVASVFYRATRYGKPVIAGIVFFLVMAKAVAIFMYSGQNSVFPMRTHIADVIIGTVLFIAAWVALARYAGKHTSLQARPRL